ncbi:hypothetical protein EVAR_22460_1 [Eumeta japonica]|uniref:Uncharacterized protein n=1 Tax=Eumeta variegata TaxID=151549 RepID=A0A4C1VB10_EUMVA|nr:hypothetical protein EVAR_22460_1 [Eumeta japonica]
MSRYTMLLHRQATRNPQRMRLLAESAYAAHAAADGLTTVGARTRTFRVVHHRLFTLAEGLAHHAGPAQEMGVCQRLLWVTTSETNGFEIAKTDQSGEPSHSQIRCTKCTGKSLTMEVSFYILRIEVRKNAVDYSLRVQSSETWTKLAPLYKGWLEVEARFESSLTQGGVRYTTAPTRTENGGSSRPEDERRLRTHGMQSRRMECAHRRRGPPDEPDGHDLYPKYLIQIVILFELN